MPNEQIYNKVVVNNTTLIDLSEDTVTSANHIVSGRVGHLADGSQVTGTYSGAEPSLQSKTATPTESAQTITADTGYDGLSSVEVGAISNTYVGSGITRRDGDDLTASGATVSVPAGYYNIAASKTIDNANLVFNSISNSTPDIGNTSGKLTLFADVDVRTGNASTGGYVAGGQQSLGTAKVYLYSNASYNDSNSVSVSDDTITIPAGYYNLNVTKSVASGTAGTPTATKGTVSNHSISVTPSVTNTTGYITGGTKSGTAVSVSASELVSGTYSVTSSGTKDVTNYASASVPAGTAGTPSASKGTVSNHSISVTPTVTNTTGFITGDTKTGTAVTVSASELVSGTLSVTTNGTNDVTNYASVNVNVENMDFIVTLTKNTSTGNWEPDCTYAEALEALNADKEFIFVAVQEVNGGTSHVPCYGVFQLEPERQLFYEVNELFYDDLNTKYSIYDKAYTFTSSGVSLLGDATFQYTMDDDATPADVVSGKTFHNATEGTQTGTLVVSNDFIVTLNKNASTGVWEPDCTYAELLSAYNNLKQISFRASDDTPATWSVETINNNIVFHYVVFEYNSTIDAEHAISYTFNSSGVSHDEDSDYYSCSDATASASDVVSGQVFYNASGKQTGTLVIQHYYTGSSAPSSSLGANGDIYLQS